MITGLQPLPEPPSPELDGQTRRLGTIAGAIVFGTAVLFWGLGVIAPDPDAAPQVIANPEQVQGSDLVDVDPREELRSVDAADLLAEDATAEIEGAPDGVAASSAITMQVLNATGVPGQSKSWVADFEEAGHIVRTVSTAARQYDQTTVFYEGGNREVAEQLAATYGFDVVEPALDNLTAKVMVHVVLGKDAL